MVKTPSTPWLLVQSLLVMMLLVEKIHTQSLSLEYNSQPLPDHSLLLLTNIGEETATSLRCLTSRADCCLPGSAGSESSEWIFPSGSLVDNATSTTLGVDLYRDRVAGGIDLFRRNNATSPEGLYRCEIPANAAAQEPDVVYVGLYLEGNGERTTLYIIGILLSGSCGTIVMP